MINASTEQKKLVITLVLGCFWLWPAAALGADPFLGAQQERAEESVSKKSYKGRETKQNIRNYRGDQKSFRRACELMIADGQSQWFLEFLNASDRYETECPACKDFFRSFLRSCRARLLVAVKRIEEEALKEQEQEQTDRKLNIKQLDPHPILLDQVSRFFVELADDEEKQAANSYQAVSVLTGAMGEREDKDLIEQNYFGTLAKFIQAPFSKFEKSTLDGDKPERGVQFDVNSLFEF